jgi:hypothetical protein
MSKYNQKYKGLLFLSYGKGLGRIYHRGYNNNMCNTGDIGC